jgi:GntR family transcriptional regulator, trigonelline degradation regulator
VVLSDDQPDLSMRIGRVAAPLREQVLELLRNAILDFRYKPGQRLIERELIEQIGVSRTTIREVLRELGAEGLVETVPQKGAIVVVPTAEEAAEIYEVRGALEALAARKFVERADEAELAALRAAADDFEAVVTGGEADIATLLRSKDGFYGVLLAGAGNRTITSVLSGLQARVRMLRAASLSQPGRPEQALKELRMILAAAEAGDGDAAAAACLTHLNRAASIGLEAISGDGEAAANFTARA